MTNKMHYANKILLLRKTAKKKKREKNSLANRIVIIVFKFSFSMCIAISLCELWNFYQSKANSVLCVSFLHLNDLHPLI